MLINTSSIFIDPPVGSEWSRLAQALILKLQKELLDAEATDTGRAQYSTLHFRQSQAEKDLTTFGPVEALLF